MRQVVVAHHKLYAVAEYDRRKRLSHLAVQPQPGTQTTSPQGCARIASDPQVIRRDYDEVRGIVTKSLLILFSFAVLASASDDKTDRATLKGIKSMCLVVEIADQAHSKLNKEELQTEIEGKLKQAGIAIDKNGTTCLYLNVRVLQAIGRQAIRRKEKPIPLYAIDLRLEFLQTVALTRDLSAKTYAPTWSTANMATVASDDLVKTTLEITTSLVDQFIAGYKSVNPN